MSLSLVTLILLFIQLLEPTGDSVTISVDRIYGYALCFASGILLTVMNYFNKVVEAMKHPELTGFYGNAIAACFSPFFILKDISDRKRASLYGPLQVQLMAGICLIAVVKALVLDRKHEGPGPNFECLSVLVALLIDLFWFQVHPAEPEHYLLMVGCAGMAMCGSLLLTGRKRLQLNIQ